MPQQHFDDFQKALRRSLVQSRVAKVSGSIDVGSRFDESDDILQVTAKTGDVNGPVSVTPDLVHIGNRNIRKVGQVVASILLQYLRRRDLAWSVRAYLGTYFLGRL